MLFQITTKDIAIFSLYILSLLLFFIPNFSQPFKEKFLPSTRKIISVTTGPISPSIKNAKVFKVKSADGIWIEIYDQTTDGPEAFLAKYLIPDPHDGKIQLLGRAQNLALKDMNNVSGFEIIAPTYSTSLMPRLNILQYDESTKKLSPYIE